MHLLGLFFMSCLIVGVAMMIMIPLQIDLKSTSKRWTNSKNTGGRSSNKSSRGHSRRMKGVRKPMPEITIVHSN